MTKRRVSQKRRTLGSELDARLAREAECSPVMIRHVLRWGLGKEPSPERQRAYRTLWLHGKLP